MRWVSWVGVVSWKDGIEWGGGSWGLISLMKYREGRGWAAGGVPAGSLGYAGHSVQGSGQQSGMAASLGWFGAGVVGTVGGRFVPWGIE